MRCGDPLAPGATRRHRLSNRRGAARPRPNPLPSVCSWRPLEHRILAGGHGGRRRGAQCAPAALVVVEELAADDEGLGPRARHPRHLVFARRVEVSEAIGGAHVGLRWCRRGQRPRAARHHGVLVRGRGERARVRRLALDVAVLHGVVRRGAGVQELRVVLHGGAAERTPLALLHDLHVARARVDLPGHGVRDLEHLVHVVERRARGGVRRRERERRRPRTHAAGVLEDLLRRVVEGEAGFAEGLRVDKVEHVLVLLGVLALLRLEGVRVHQRLVARVHVDEHGRREDGRRVVEEARLRLRHGRGAAVVLLEGVIGALIPFEVEVAVQVHVVLVLAHRGARRRLRLHLLAARDVEQRDDHELGLREEILRALRAVAQLREQAERNLARDVLTAVDPEVDHHPRPVLRVALTS
mmetsp:Transcript_60294/g.144928  ORF Transcript_60294/g.144928 Transcript_60294/m.144928 type:complete len:412 (-) Transcript_60294:135-1370(-)